MISRNPAPRNLKLPEMCRGRPQRWTEAFVRQHWDAMVEHFGRLNPRYVGAGHHGVVFSRWGRPGVVKLTADPFEMSTILAIHRTPKLDGHPGVVHVEDVVQLGEGAWAYLAERLRPIPTRMRVSRPGSLVWELGDYRGAVSNLPWDDSKRSWKSYRDCIKVGLGKIAALPGGEALADFLNLFGRHLGVWFEDLYEDNLGLRDDGTMVVLDLGWVRLPTETLERLGIPTPTGLF